MPGLLAIAGFGLFASAALYGGWGWLLVWPGANFLAVAVAYLMRAPGIFGKQSSGRLRSMRVFLLFPYFLYSWMTWWLQTRLSSEPLCHEVAPGIWLGRRASRAELPADLKLVVDLSSEFPVACGVVEDLDYLCEPTLDLTAPSKEKFPELIERLRACEVPAYIHCALGHGRSACVAAGVLLARGLAESFEEAEAKLKSVRPGVHLQRDQRRLVQEWWNTARPKP